MEPTTQASNKSPTIGKLAEALSKAQGVIEGAKKDALNPHFGKKYADLASVWDACRKPLSDNGLAVIQTNVESPDCVIVETILAHSSGEWISGRLSIRPVKTDPQGVVSACTYARRTGLAAIVGVSPEDDDGNSVSNNTTRSTALPPLKTILTSKQPEGSVSAAEPSKGLQGAPAKESPKLDQANELCKPLDDLMNETGISETFIIELTVQACGLDKTPLSIADFPDNILKKLGTKNSLTQIVKRWNDRDKAKYPETK